MPGICNNIGRFFTWLSAAIVRKTDISVKKAKRSQAYELVNHLNALRSDCTLQLCFWHIAEALKAWLIKEGYPKEIKE